MCEAAETYINDNVIETSIIPNDNSFQDVASRLDKLYLNFDSDTDESDLSTSVQDDFNDICFANACSPVVLDNQYPIKYVYNYGFNFSFNIFYLQTLY